MAKNPRLAVDKKGALLSNPSDYLWQSQRELPLAPFAFRDPKHCVVLGWRGVVEASVVRASAVDDDIEGFPALGGFA